MSNRTKFISVHFREDIATEFVELAKETDLKYSKLLKEMIELYKKSKEE